MRWLFRKIKSLFVKKKRPVEKPIIIPPNNSTGSAYETEINYRKPNWHTIWSITKIDSHARSRILKYADKIIVNKSRYKSVAAEVNPLMPWWFVAVLHFRESSLRFNAVLHNGENIIGTRRKTRLVPKGRGPFKTWEESAIDALKIKRYHKHKDWAPGDCLAKAERFNGLGYRSRIGDNGVVELSPYVMAYTNLHDEDSKFWRDGEYNKNAPEKQLGVAAIMKGLEMRGELELNI